MIRISYPAGSQEPVMFAFLSRRPGLTLVSIISVCTAGVVAAHRQRPPKAPLVLRSSRPQEAKPTRRAAWRTELDLDRATLKDGALVQTQKDGTRVTFTLRPKLQEQIRSYLARFQLPYSAAVAYDLRSGEILALTGHSEQDPKLDARHLCLTPWAPAASTFKVVTAAALLDRGVPSTTKVCYHGGLHGLTRRNLATNASLDTTCRTFSDALAKSINPIMGKLALRHLDPARLLGWARQFGFNQPIPFDFAVEPSRATIPRDSLEFARTAAGFWHTNISALHGAVIAAVPASGGKLRWPHLVRSVHGPDGKARAIQRRPARRVLSSAAARQLRAMMARTTTHGSGQRGFVSRRGARLLPIDVAGKTGSLARQKPFLHYSWFIGFAPVGRPKIAFAVLLGNPPRWRIKASAAAQQLVAYYLQSERGEHPPKQ